MRFWKFFNTLGLMMGILLTDACAADARQRLFIIGQDLDSIRGYYASDCCPVADAHTAYLDLYNLLSAPGGFGGLGVDENGTPLEWEHEWGAGPVSAWKTATEFGGDLVIGLSMTENDHPGAIAQLLEGGYDENIRHLGRFIRALDGTVYLRIGYEFDGSWNQGYADRPRYARAFRRVVDVLRRQKVENVRFVWQSASSPLLGPAGGN